ncbi:uncharacterized protein LOC141853590 [Brevipalpus obovatus]|uniref:uncharacterized protein LOC141853590 n=1 Tax=Brevipalpus obovatus TaxID=246614 RepID=UPI003D9DE410
MNSWVVIIFFLSSLVCGLEVDEGESLGPDGNRSITFPRPYRPASDLTRPLYIPLDPRRTWRNFQENVDRNEKREEEENRRGRDKKRDKRQKLITEIKRLAQLSKKLLMASQKIARLLDLT